jgi:hypothetical protein
MDVMNVRLWIIFYLICFVAVLWATFLLVQGFMLVVSIVLVSIVIGSNCILLYMDVRAYTKKQKALKQISLTYITDSEDQQVNGGKNRNV